MTVLANSSVPDNASLAHRVWDKRLPEILLAHYWCWLGSQPVLASAAVSWTGYKSRRFGGVERNSYSGRIDSVHMLVGEVHASQDRSVARERRESAEAGGALRW